MRLVGRGNGFSDKSDYWKCVEAALLGYLSGKVGRAVAIDDICRDVPEAGGRTSATLALAQLRHEGRVVLDGNVVVSTD